MGALAASPRVACAQCDAPLMLDQRYCVECGARRLPLPPNVAKLIAGVQPAFQPAFQPLLEPVELGPGETLAEESPDPDTQSGFKMPTAKAAAVAIMAMLSFGVAVGALISSSTSKTLLVQSVPPAQPATSKTAPVAAATIPSVSAPLIQLPAQASQAAPTPSAGKAPKLPSTSLPPIKHVFMIALSNQGFNQAFGPDSPAPYLATDLTKQGELLQNYYAVTQGELANEIALISGQGPTSQTAANCPTYTDVTPGTAGVMGQVQGDGCVYPPPPSAFPISSQPQGSRGRPTSRTSATAPRRARRRPVAILPSARRTTHMSPQPGTPM